jgi:hypothetical protein
MFSLVKHRHEGFPQPLGQLHSEQRIRQTVPVTQQNHSPLVLQPTGQPPPYSHFLQGNAGVTTSHSPTGDPHGLQGPPPQPMQPRTEPSVTSVRVR